MTHEDLARRVRDCCRLTGSFVLRSGRTTDEYFDKYQFEADPALLSELAEAMVPLIPAGTEVLAGLEMGGIPVVTALGQRSGLPCAFDRQEGGADALAGDQIRLHALITREALEGLEQRSMQEVAREAPTTRCATTAC